MEEMGRREGRNPLNLNEIWMRFMVCSKFFERCLENTSPLPVAIQMTFCVTSRFNEMRPSFLTENLLPFGKAQLSAYYAVTAVSYLQGTCGPISSIDALLGSHQHI